MDVSIIIVNYNTQKMTNEAIDSVLEHTMGIEYEIILVDNASTDGSRHFFSSKNEIRYIYSEKNLGFGQGNNLGLKHATGRNILFLNSDTLLRNNAVKILSDYLDANSKVGVCGGNLYDYNNNPTVSYEIFRPSVIRELNEVLSGRLYRLLFKDTIFNSSGSPKNVGYVSGADFMTRKSILDKYGSLSPEFFMYYEETELADRISKAGYSIFSVPQAEIIHLQGMSFKGESPSFNATKYTWMCKSFWKYLRLCNSKLSICLIKHIHLLYFNYVSKANKNIEIAQNAIEKKKIFVKCYKDIICQ